MGDFQMVSRYLTNDWRKPLSTLNFRVKVRDFGPISKADVTVRPLTILVGPNRSGKSQIAMLIHSLILSHNKMRFRIFDLNTRYSVVFQKKLMSVIKDASRQKGDKISISSTKMHNLRREYTAFLFRNVLAEELQSCFSATPDQLTRFGKRSYEIKISKPKDFRMVNQKNSFSLRMALSQKINLVIRQGRVPSYEIYTDKNGNPTYELKTNIRTYRSRGNMGIEIMNAIEARVSQDMPLTSYYFPAARSGILHAHRTVAASMIRNAGRNAIMGVQIPQILGTIRDFVSDLTEIRPTAGTFKKMGEMLEQEMIGGLLKLSSPKVGIPEIEYEYDDHKIPLHRVSSSISEIAPITLFLKYMVMEGDLLIIEEPEAHLHPSNQLILARYIVKMIRAGLNVLITTHSTLILEQLSNFLQASKIDKGTKSKLKFGTDEYLTTDEIAPYLHVGSSEEGYEILPIKFSERDGITQEEFMKIEDELTRQTWHIENGMSEEK